MYSVGEQPDQNGGCSCGGKKEVGGEVRGTNGGTTITTNTS